MGIANKVINILVLIAAIGAAVCAFLLWQKREQITKGREMLSKAIVEAVHKIDSGEQIKVESMSIKLPADQLKEPIDTLQKNVDKICEQRNVLAKAFSDVVNSVKSLSSSLDEKVELSEKELKDYKVSGEKCKEGVDLVEKRIAYYKERNEVIKAGLKDLASALELAGISNDKFWNNAELGRDLSSRTNRAREFSTRFHKYAGHILASTDKLRSALSSENVDLKKPSLGLETKNWRKELSSNLEGIDAVVKKIGELREAAEKLKKENEELKNQLREKDEQLKKKDGEIAALNRRIAEDKAEIKRLKKIIDPNSEDDGDAEGAGGKDGKAAAQQMDFTSVKKLIGKVTYVNQDYGFVAIDLGTKATVKAIGVDGREINKTVPLPHGAILTVATSLNPDDAKYIARIVVTKIGTDSSIANILPQPGSSMPKVGDTVFFSDSDLRQMLERRERELKLAEEAAAREKAKEAIAAIDEEGTKKDKSSSEEESDDKEESEDDGKKSEKSKDSSSGSASDGKEDNEE